MTEFYRYFAAGGTAAACHFLVLAVLVEVYRIDPTIATAVGFVVAIFVNYSIQYHWTFRTQVSHKSALTKYVTITTIMFFLNTSLFWLGVSAFDQSYLLIQIVVTMLIFLANFYLNRRFVFR